MYTGVLKLNVNRNAFRWVVDRPTQLDYIFDIHTSTHIKSNINLFIKRQRKERLEEDWKGCRQGLLEGDWKWLQGLLEGRNEAE